MFAASDGKGHIALLWFPPPSQWPAGGWRLSDSTGQTLVPQISMGDATALQSLSVEDADAIRKLPAVLAQPDTSAQRRNLINILGLRVFSEPAYARAMGLAWAADNVAAGSRTYKVEGLDASGKTTGLQLTSPPADASVATQLPPAPTGVQTRVDESGVALSGPRRSRIVNSPSLLMQSSATAAGRCPRPLRPSPSFPACAGTRRSRSCSTATLPATTR